MDENSSAENGVETDKSNARETNTDEDNQIVEPYKGMIFESEEAAKLYYDAYARQMGFAVRFDSCTRSPHDGNITWRQFVCNKEGYNRSKKMRKTEDKQPKVVTREGCKARIIVRREKAGNWIVSQFTREHSHPLNVASSFINRRAVLLSQTPDEKDARIRELATELLKERKKNAALQAHLDKVLKEMENHADNISRNIDDIAQCVRDIDANKLI